MGGKSHVKLGHRTEYKCDYCDKLSTKKGLIRHFRRKHVESRTKMHYCTKCDIVFAYIEEVIEHISLTHASDKQKYITADQFKCQLCHKAFLTLKRLQYHIKKKHGNANAVVVNEKNSESNLENMQTQEEEELPLLDSQAIRNGDIKFPETVPNELQKPQEEMSLINSQNKEYEGKLSENILNELQIVQDQNEHQICHEPFVEQDQQNSLAKSYPLVKTPFECEICHELFSLKVSLEEHRLTHTVKNLKQCNICHSYFSLRNSLKKSHGIVNAEPLGQCETKSLMCNICEKLFSNEMYLDRHMVVTHTGQKPHDCETCQAAVCIESQLVRLLTFRSENTQHEQGTFLEAQYNSMKATFYKTLLSHVENSLHENEGCNLVCKLQVPGAKLIEIITID